jgi:hypothetical protein
MVFINYQEEVQKQYRGATFFVFWNPMILLLDFSAYFALSDDDQTCDKLVL